ncbi:unnamed protein product [Schistocephalus solidus]|uniref:RES domain-containing protein n=1 Tax=Schistocephalus solidus TaxID=70667 RepID=A0A183T9J4_SCHSO|nr:unnamed protein product [Schistocephalus solidus]
MWCKQLVLALNRAFFDMVDPTNLTPFPSRETRMAVIRSHLVSQPISFDFTLPGRPINPEPLQDFANCLWSYEVNVKTVVYEAQWTSHCTLLKLGPISQFDGEKILLFPYQSDTNIGQADALLGLSNSRTNEPEDSIIMLVPVEPEVHSLLMDSINYHRTRWSAKLSGELQLFHQRRHSLYTVTGSILLYETATKAPGTIEKYTGQDLPGDVEQRDASVIITELPVPLLPVEMDDGRVFEFPRNFSLAPHLLEVL